MAEPGLTLEFPEPAPAEPPPPESASYVVRYGRMRLLGEFSARRMEPLARDTEVIVKSERGSEWGVVLRESDDRTAELLGTSERRPGRILRLVTSEDRRSRDDVAEREVRFFADGERLIAERSLQMQLVDVEQIFGGERLVFYYLAEKRVDFRELVKAMARQFNTRIEMRQIGVRDEARLLADYGDCGKPVCCGTHLQEMPPVSMKMAKLQKASLDPAKISGRCGRLKCCLRYEYDTYEAHRRELPRVNATVVTRDGQGRVIAQELLAKKLLVVFEDGRRVMVGEDDIITVVSKGRPAEKKRGAADPGQNENR